MSSMLVSSLQCAAVAALVYSVWILFFSALRNIPGPFLAKFTDLWRLCSMLGRRPEITQRQLHDKYGPVVRLGPNMISISEPAMIDEIYSRKTTLIKGDFYKAHDLNVAGRRVPSVFSTRDEQLNTQILKPIYQVYSMGYMIRLEPLIDKTIDYFLACLSERFARVGKPCDIDNWLHYCAWDVIGEITFSERLGFLEQGRDVQGILAINHAALDYTSIVGMMPWLDYLFERNPIKRVGPPSFVPAVSFAMKRVSERRSGKDNHDETSTSDMLDRFLEEQAAQPDVVNEDILLAYNLMNIVAGSDTVAAELRAIVYYLCKSPEAMRKLTKELDAADLSTPVSWAKCQELPYLCACVSEGLRILPGVGLPMERVVGPSGLIMPDGKTFLQPGTTVGMNPYVVHRDQATYGADTHAFRPERWLRGDGEPEQAYQTRLGRMKAADLTFGAGKRACIGRNLALIECHKIIASLLRTFDVELADPQEEWKTHNAWLMRQSNMNVNLKRRLR